MRTAHAILRSIRPNQWTKNILVFAALIFANRAFELELWWTVVQGFLCFCMVAGAIYILNDLKDAKGDRVHPTKRLRPIAAGELSTGWALGSALVFLIGGITWGCTLGLNFGLLLFVYVLWNQLYTWWMKRVVILDLLGVSMGFVMRAVGGGLLVEVKISAWLLICTILLSLFLVLGKRRQEMLTALDNPGTQRSVLKEYSIELLDQMISVVTASVVVAYAVYTLSPKASFGAGTPHLEYTIPFVLYGIFRYLYLIHQRNLGESPERIILTDFGMIVNLICYAASVLFILYGLPNWTH